MILFRNWRTVWGSILWRLLGVCFFFLTFTASGTHHRFLNVETQSKTEASIIWEQERANKWNAIAPVLKKWLMTNEDNGQELKLFFLNAVFVQKKGKEPKTYYLDQFPDLLLHKSFEDLEHEHFYPQLDALITDQISVTDLETAFDQAKTDTKKDQIWKSYRDLFFNSKYEKIILDGFQASSAQGAWLLVDKIPFLINQIFEALLERSTASDKNKDYSPTFGEYDNYNVKQNIFNFVLAGVTPQRLRLALDKVSKVQKLWQELTAIFSKYSLSDIWEIEIENKIYPINGLIGLMEKENPKLTHYLNLPAYWQPQIINLYDDQITASQLEKALLAAKSLSGATVNPPSSLDQDTKNIDSDPSKSSPESEDETPSETKPPINKAKTQTTTGIILGTMMGGTSLIIISWVIISQLKKG